MRTGSGSSTRQRDRHPFAQDATLAAAEPKPPSKLVVSWASGNNPLFGPHAPEWPAAPRRGGATTSRATLLRLGRFAHQAPRAHRQRQVRRCAALRGTTCLHPVGPNFAVTLIGHLVPLPPDTSFGRPWWEETPVETVVPYRHRAGLLEQIAVRQDKTMLLYTTTSGESHRVHPCRRDEAEKPRSIVPTPTGS